MKLAIVGVRGVPNIYGGFEQFAEYLSKELVSRGHEVVVYSPHNHPYQDSEWNGVSIVHKFDPDNLGPFSQFVYDFNCIKHTRSQNFDVILQLGYTSSSIWHWLFPKGINVVTNMDGLEWKRTKYAKPVQRFLKWAESLAAKHSQHLVADSIGIKNYLKEKYSLDSTFIAYGANLVEEVDLNVVSEFGLNPGRYNILIARMEPENNVETIIKGSIASESDQPLVVVGDYTKTPFGKYLYSKYNVDTIKFLGSIYDIEKLNSLRWYSNLYFHGHSVGGTNPSLLEAMASNSLVCAHNNVFNKAVCGENAFYFDNESDVAELVSSKNKEDHAHILSSQKRVLAEKYSWNSIIDQYESLLISLAK